MNSELFKNALSSLIVTSDYVSFLETGCSFILQTMTALGHPETEAAAFLRSYGEQSQAATIAYLDCFRHFGLEEDFTSWSYQNDVTHQGKERIINDLLSSFQTHQTLH